MRIVNDYLHPARYPEDYLGKLGYVRYSIYKKLSEYENFDGLDFNDVTAGGIQIRAFHKDVKHYSYGDSITMRYDFSNMEECINKFIKMWESYDTTEDLKGYQSFLKDGETYGWD